MLTTIIRFVITNRHRFLIGAGILIGLLFVVFLFRSCSVPASPKLNEAEIQRGEQAVKEQNRRELEEVLVAAEVREQQINANLSASRADAINAIADARKRYREMTNDELATEFEKRR